MFEKHQISGVFVSTSKAHRISSYLQKENIKGICVVGFDLVSKNIELLESGYISYLINQNPKRQAQQSITTLRNYFLYKQVADLVKFFPIEIIIKSNLSNYSVTTMPGLPPIDLPSGPSTPLRDRTAD
jgi:LacI family transcriptional regulator